MSAKLDDRAKQLLQAKNFCHVSTLRADGSVHCAPVWVDVRDDEVVLNSAEGRLWPSNLERDPRVTLTVQNLENPYEYLEVRGRVSGRSHEGADAHIDELAMKYLGKEQYPYRQAGEQRVIIRIAPDTASVRGS